MRPTKQLPKRFLQSRKTLAFGSDPPSCVVRGIRHWTHPWKQLHAFSHFRRFWRKPGMALPRRPPYSATWRTPCNSNQIFADSGYQVLENRPRSQIRLNAPRASEIEYNVTRTGMAHPGPAAADLHSKSNAKCILNMRNPPIYSFLGPRYGP